MADDGGGPLPPGWDRKYDHRTGRYYYVNYFNKTTTWEDPRSRYRQLNQVTPQHVPAPTMVENIPLQDMTSVRPSPIPGRVAAVAPARSPFSSPARSANIAESSMTTDPDVAAAKIGAMFPTVSDTHIRALLMKYHNREAVVVSALQVEKHPLTTPGPYATPPVAVRRPGHVMWEGPGSRSGSPAPRPPHSSPKMKLRYLKSVFPKVEETLLLDILSNSDNNVMKATEKLQTMGFEKRDTPPPRLTLRGKSEENTASTQARPTGPHPTPPPRMKSAEEKQKMKARLQERYKDVPDRVLCIALDSVDYDEERAAQILQIMVQEEERTSQQRSASKTDRSVAKDVQPETSAPRTPSRKMDSPAHKKAGSTHGSAHGSPARKAVVEAVPLTPTSHSKRSKGKKDVPKTSRGTCTAEDGEYRSPYLSKPSGPNPRLRQGANDELLLADYVTWSGPNPELLQTPTGRVSLAKGPDPSLLGERTYKPRGPNADLRKGPMRGLAKGSIYSRLTASASSHVLEESRGK